MQDPQVENKFKVTRRLYYEGMKAISDYKQTVTRIGIMLFALWLAFAVFTISEENGILFVLAELLIAAVLFGLVLLFYSKGRWNKAYRSMLTKNGGEIPVRTTKFYEDYFVIVTESGELKLMYDSVKKIYETENLIILFCQDKRGVMLAKDGFVKGTWEDTRKKLTSAV